MNNAIARPPAPVNEPVKSYAPGSPERASLRAEVARMGAEHREILPYINGKTVETGRTVSVVEPHDHQHELATVHNARKEDVEAAIQGALDARHDWSRMAWTDRAAVFLKAAELLAGPFRDRMNASTMLGQSKNVFQAEIDAAAEMVDFFRFNVHFMRGLYEDQPVSDPGIWNRTEYRGLEGFVFAVSPFNFTSIAANLCAAPAMMGNTVVWKPAPTQMLSAQVIVELFEEAGLPPGVIQMLPGEGADVGDPVIASEHLAGLHFTGSTKTFQHLWHTVGSNLDHYRTYPRIVGETGGKDFIVAHESANADAVATAIVRGSFEYQGQKCSAASRVYLPESLWPAVKESLLSQLDEITVGAPQDFSNFVNAVIDDRAFAKITGYIDRAQKASGVDVIAGGTYSDETGYFVDPTVLVAEDPRYQTMEEEIFGPVASVYVAPKSQSFDEVLELVDSTSPYALTGAVFAQDRRVIAHAADKLAEAAGNFYINDKPTGAVVGQQPFGGARGSGTNDKAGSMLNLLRWTSLRSIKENFVSPKHFAYPFHQNDEA
ncbi:L-glutamate gamma-semialdehyde dehydrogenase [Rubricoccus marinus]|uniref:L-glutamate gamma-semialdehyde dehydrogenase n=1 Tax=Rubricoccus marinus TaxID=716817 RepID=A0A259TYE6_9BACT|nr:L-glutamate gamma-semialdehyde dehydrogenase [Rubricoccus marinus]OZC02772.1 1-pyrroline-5-carboxylate dehydrogenase [Rubricoccus marinus]